MAKKGLKFYHKSSSRLIPILELLKEGITGAEISRKLGMSEPHISYYVKKAGKMGLLQEERRGSFKSYELTQMGKKFFEQYQYKHDVHRKNSHVSVSLCRAENIRFKADALTNPSNLVDWEHVQMNNWKMYRSKIDSVGIKINLGKQPTVEFLPSPIDGSDVFELITILLQECQDAAFRLKERTGLVVGPLRLEKRGEWVVYSPQARWFSSRYGQVTIKDVGKVNASKPRCIGEFEYQDPRDAADHMLMPRRIERIEATQERLVGLVEALGNDKQSQIMNHFSVDRNLENGERK